jgi:hypothetical protein
MLIVYGEKSKGYDYAGVGSDFAFCCVVGDDGSYCGGFVEWKGW